jgi:hypothetical protein
VHGSGEQLRACVDSTNRLSDDPAKANRNYMVGIWHVDEVGSSTDVSWNSDGTCINRHIYENGFELDLKNDVCTWSYKPVPGHDDEFEMDWASKMLGPSYPKQLIFKIKSRTQMRNINIGYDAFRIICPTEELAIRQGELAALQKQAAQNPGNTNDELALATGFDKVGTVFEAQNDFTNAYKTFDQELTVCQKFAADKSAGPDCLSRSAQSFEVLGNQDFNFAITHDQAGDGQGGTQLATAALEAYQKDTSTRLQLLRADPSNVEAQHNAALASNHAGLVLYWIGQNKQGIDAIRTAAQMLESIVASHRGTRDISVDLIWILFNLSQRSNVGTEAKDSLAKALAIAMQLQRDHQGPDNISSIIALLQQAKPLK